MRLPSAWPLLFALALSACFNPEKVDPGPRLVDDFEDDDLSPTWSRFDNWSCDVVTSGEPGGAGPDGGPDGGLGGGADGGLGGGADGGLGGGADGGLGGGAAAGSVTCALESTGDGVGQHALLATFQLADPADGVREHPAAEVFTHTHAGTVDLTAFTQLVFSAWLDGTPALPAGTQLVVGLGCSSFVLGPVATDPVASADVTTGDWVRVALMLADFKQESTSHNQACLAQIDSIRFAVVPGLADGQAATGTFQLDNIKLQN